jgi:hypothetical protein
VSAILDTFDRDPSPYEQFHTPVPEPEAFLGFVFAVADLCLEENS